MEHATAFFKCLSPKMGNALKDTPATAGASAHETEPVYHCSMQKSVGIEGKTLILLTSY